MVEATLNYLATPTERPFFYTYAPPEGERPRNTRGDRRTLPIRDARALSPAADLDREGFALAHLATSVSNLYDADAVPGRFYPEVEALLLKCFDSAPVPARFTAHTAFDPPDVASDAPPRESIEVRTLAFFGRST